jgi:hypothetical protein
MFFRFPVLAAAAVVILAAAGGARATMPMLSSEPFPASPAACQKWADLQSGDALDMWGLNEDGSWSREVAVLRLTLTCLGGARPEIVGFGSSVGFDDAYCTKHREFGICKKRAADKPTVSADEFVFGGSGVANSGNPAESIRISEQIGPSALKRRFRAYTVRLAKGEDCLTCATISGRPGIIEVDYGPDGKTVMGVASRDEKSADAFGNRVGGSLAAATGAVARCDSGMELTCASSKLKGLSYVVAEDDKCQVEVGEGSKLSRIPDCARIGGFRIFR